MSQAKDRSIICVSNRKGPAMCFLFAVSGRTDSSRPEPCSGSTPPHPLCHLPLNISPGCKLLPLLPLRKFFIKTSQLSNKVRLLSVFQAQQTLNSCYEGVIYLYMYILKKCLQHVRCISNENLISLFEKNVNKNCSSFGALADIPWGSYVTDRSVWL